MQTIIVDITPGYRMPTIHFSQGDVGTQFAINLRSRFGDSLPASPTVTIQATKPSGFGYQVAADSVSDGIATFTFTSSMTNEAGRFPAELKVVKDSVTLYTANFYMEGEESPHPEGTVDGDADNPLIENLETIITNATDAWLNDHPEATTTVQDGSVTKIKLADSLQNIIDIKDASISSNYVLNGSVARVINMNSNDIATLLNSLFASNDIAEVVVPAGNYTISSTVSVPTGKTLNLAGDYHDAGIAQAIIAPSASGITLIKLNSKCALIGGVFNLGAYANTTAVALDCFNQGIEWTSVRNTKIVGGRTSHSILTQTGIKIECDDISQTITEQGYLMFCEFDAYIENLGFAYHFHRQRADGSASGVWLTDNTILGYIGYCTRYIWFDFATGAYANNQGHINVTCQAGWRIAGEPNYPAINIKGIGIVVEGNLWDFREDIQYPAVLLEYGASNCMIFPRCTVVNEGVEDDNIINSILAQNNIRFKPAISLSETAINNNYITDLDSQCYEFGNIILLHGTFKIGANIPSWTHLFDITGDSYKYPIFADLYNNDNMTKVGSIVIDHSAGHATSSMQAISSSTAWIHFDAIAISNRA